MSWYFSFYCATRNKKTKMLYPLGSFDNKGKSRKGVIVWAIIRNFRKIYIQQRTIAGVERLYKLLRKDQACGDCSVAHKSELIEILEFTHFFEHFTFEKTDWSERGKHMKKYIRVVVAVELVTVGAKIEPTS